MTKAEKSGSILWAVVFAFLALGILAKALIGLFHDSVPALGIYYSGFQGRMLASSYVGIAIGMIFLSIFVKNFNKLATYDKYRIYAIWTLIISGITMFTAIAL